MMRIRIKGIMAFLCVFLLAFPAAAVDADLNGRWVSLQYGVLSFTQSGNSFTAVWTGVNAAGEISDHRASFRFWSGASFEKSADDSRGYGSLALSADGRTLSGSWANLSKAEPESGSFTAIRMASISGQTTQDSVPALEEEPGAQPPVTESAPPDAGPAAQGSTQQAAAGSQASAAAPSNELDLVPGNIPPEYLGPITEVMSELEESVLKIFDIFDGDSGDDAQTVPGPSAEASAPDNAPLQESGSFWNFLSDLWTALWGQ